MPSEDRAKLGIGSQALALSLRKPAVLKQPKTKATRKGELADVIVEVGKRLEALRTMTRAEAIDTFGAVKIKSAKIKELEADLVDLRRMAGKDKKRGVSKN